MPNQPAAALYGIEKTNRGCGFNAAYDAGKFIPPARTLDDQPGPGVATRPGGLPLFKSNAGAVVMAAGVGVGRGGFECGGVCGFGGGDIWLSRSRRRCLIQGKVH